MLLDDPAGELDDIEHQVRLYINIPAEDELFEGYRNKVVDYLLKVAEHYQVKFKDGVAGTRSGAIGGEHISDELAKARFIEHHQKTWYQGPGFSSTNDHTHLDDILYWTRTASGQEKFFRASMKKCYSVRIRDRALQQKPFSGILIVEQKFHRVYWQKLGRWRDTFLKLHPDCSSITAHARGFSRKP